MWTGTSRRRSRRCYQQVGLLWRPAALNEHDLVGLLPGFLSVHSPLKCKKAVLSEWLSEKHRFTSNLSCGIAGAPWMELHAAKFASAVSTEPAHTYLQPCLAVALATQNFVGRLASAAGISFCVHSACRAAPRAATPLPRRPSWRGWPGHACHQGPQPIPASAACSARQCTLPDSASRWAAFCSCDSRFRAQNPCW